MSQLQSFPTGGEMRYINQETMAALNEWFCMSEPATALENLKALMRGWIMSELPNGTDARQRSEIYYDFERLCELLQRLKEAQA